MIPELRGGILCIEEGLEDENRDNLARLRFVRNRKLALRKKQEALKKIKDEEDRIKYLAEIEVQKKIDEYNRLKDIAIAKKKQFAECKLKKELESLIQKLKDAQVVFSDDHVNKEGCCYERSLAADGSTVTCCERELNMLRLRPSCSDMAIFNTASAQAIIDSIPPEAMMMSAEATYGQVGDSQNVRGEHTRSAGHLNIRSITASKHPSRTAQLSKSTLGITGNKLSGLLHPTGDRATRGQKSSISLNLESMQSHRSFKSNYSKSVPKLTANRDDTATIGSISVNNKNQTTDKEDALKDGTFDAISHTIDPLADDCCQIHAKQTCFFYNFAEINNLLSKAMIEAGEILDHNNSKKDIREFYEKCQQTKAEFVRVCSDEQDPIIIFKKLEETFLNLKWDCEQMVRVGKTSDLSLSEEKLLDKCEKIAELIKQMFKGTLVDRAEIIVSATDTVFNTIKTQKDIGVLTEKDGLHMFMRAGFITKNKLHEFISYVKSVDKVEASEKEKLLRYVSCYKKAAIDFKDSLGPCPSSSQESLEDVTIPEFQDLEESASVESKIDEIDSSCKKESCSKSSSKREMRPGVDSKIPKSISEGEFIEQKDKTFIKEEKFKRQENEEQDDSNKIKQDKINEQQDKTITGKEKAEVPAKKQQIKEKLKTNEQQKQEDKDSEELPKQRSRVAKKNLTVDDLIKIVKEYAKDGLLTESVDLISSLSTTQSLKYEEEKKRVFQYSEISGVCDDPCECLKVKEIDWESSSGSGYKNTPYCPCKVHSISGAGGSRIIQFGESTPRQENSVTYMPLSKITEQNSVVSKLSVVMKDSKRCHKCFHSSSEDGENKYSNKCPNSIELRKHVLSDTRTCYDNMTDSLQSKPSSQFEGKEGKDKSSSHHTMYCTVDNTLKIKNISQEWLDAVSSLSDHKLACEIKSLIDQNDSFRSALSHVLEGDELNEQNIETSVHEIDYEAQEPSVSTTKKDHGNKKSKERRSENSFGESSHNTTQSSQSPKSSVREQKDEERALNLETVLTGKAPEKLSDQNNVSFLDPNSDIDFVKKSETNTTVKVIPSKILNVSTGENNFDFLSSSNLKRIKINTDTIMTTNIALLSSKQSEEEDKKSDKSKSSSKSSKISLIKTRIKQSINSMMKPDSTLNKSSSNRTHNAKNTGEKNYNESFGEQSQSTLKESVIEDDVRSIKTVSLKSDTSFATLRNSPNQSNQSTIHRNCDGKSLNHKSTTSYHKSRELEIEEEHFDGFEATNSFQSAKFIIEPADERSRILSATENSESRLQDTANDQNLRVPENDTAGSSVEAVSHISMVESLGYENNDFSSLSFHSFSEDEDVSRYHNQQEFGVRRYPQSCYIGRSLNSSKRSYFPNGVRLIQSERKLGNAISTPRFTRSVSLCDISRSYYRSLLMIRRNSENC